MDTALFVAWNPHFPVRGCLSRPSALATTALLLLIVLAPADPSLAHQSSHSRIDQLNFQIALVPENAGLYLERSELYRDIQHWDEARADILRAASLDPNNTDVAWLLARIHLDAGEPRSAVELLDRFLDESPEHLRALVLRAQAHRRLAQPLAAAEDYEAALEIDAESGPTFYLELAESYAEAAPPRLEEALETLERGLETVGPLLSLETRAVRLEIELGRFSQGLDRSDRVLARYPQAWQWHTTRAELLAHLGKDRRSASVEARCSETARGRSGATSKVAGEKRLGPEAPSAARRAVPGPRRGPGRGGFEMNLRISSSRPRHLCALVALIVAIAGTVLAPHPGQAQQVVRGPYLQKATPTSMVVRWRTDQATNSRVRYGNAPGLLSQRVTLSASTTEHIVELTGLSPDTLYYYEVGSTSGGMAGDDADHFFYTSPPVGSTLAQRYWVLGDSGTADSRAEAVRDAYYGFNGEAHTQAILMLGDNAYVDGTDSEYQERGVRHVSDHPARDRALVDPRQPRR